MDAKALGVNEAAAFLGYKRSYIYKMMHLGRIPYYRPNAGKAFFVQAELETFMLRGRRSADYELAARADALLLEGR